MESSYGIGITNRYSCFLDNEDDPVEALKATEVDKESKKKGKIAEKENRGKDSGDATTPTQSIFSSIMHHNLFFFNPFLCSLKKKNQFLF